MNFNDHSRLKGQHAFLSASKYHWINYDIDKLSDAYQSFQAVQRGVKLHGIANDLISEKINLPRTKATLNMYVNDAIGYRMTPEQTLYYSDNCFGTADAIAFDEKKNLLRIHDLKTGVVPAHMEQLLVYNALFCLEYRKDPYDISAELRIYQNDEITSLNPEPEDVATIMEKIIEFDGYLREIKSGG